MEIVKKAEHEFEKNSNHLGQFKQKLQNHFKELLKLVDYMTEKYKEADKEVILLSVYLHDIGYCFQKTEDDDHAVLSEKFAKDFLEKENYNEEKIKQVMHCVRAHRNRDVEPRTLEAKIMATIDSASHITGGVYIDMIMNGSTVEYIIGKIQRDYNDLGFFPEIQEEMKEICDSWLKLIKDYDKLFSKKGESWIE